MPVPCLVSVEIGVSIGSETAMFPAPTNVRVGVPVVASNELPVTSNVSVPVVLPTVAFAASVTAPVTVLLFAELSKAPVEEIPAPEIVKGSGTDSPEPTNVTAAPDSTVVPPDARPVNVKSSMK